MNRKQRRALEKRLNADPSKNLSEKISQFSTLPDECLACTKAFDKEDKEMIRTWNVVIREETNMRLYCPECWGTATQVVKQFVEEQENDRSENI